MGGKKSKPMVESARTVIARRSTPSPPPSIPTNIGKPDNMDWDPKVLSEMSKWSVVKTIKEQVNPLASWILLLE